MLTIIILLIIFIGAYSGYKNGLIIGLIRTIGYTITFNFAMDYYKLLSEYIYLFVPYPSPFVLVDDLYHYYDAEFMYSLDQSYYYLISVLIILIIGWFVTRVVSQFLSYFTEGINVPQPFDGIVGSIFGFTLNYMGTFLLLFILSTIPYEVIQNNMAESSLASSMLTSTPNLSQWSHQVFIEDVHEESIKNQPLMDIEAITNPEDAEELEENNNE